MVGTHRNGVKWEILAHVRKYKGGVGCCHGRGFNEGAVGAVV